MSANRKLAMTCTTMLLTCAGVGCKSGMGAYNVVVKYDPTLATTDVATATVHLVGITAAEKPAWEGYLVNNYLQPSDAQYLLKKSQPEGSFDFEVNLDSRNRSATLPRNDAVWTRWKKGGVMYLAIISSFPRETESGKPDAAKANDVRRLILPLDSRAWNASTIGIFLSNAGVSADPKPQPFE